VEHLQRTGRHVLRYMCFCYKTQEPQKRLIMTKDKKLWVNDEILMGLLYGSGCSGSCLQSPPIWEAEIAELQFEASAGRKSFQWTIHVWWHLTVFPGMWDTEVWVSWVKASPKQKWDSIWKITKEKLGQEHISSGRELAQ
jgi:hypothetical protein